MFPARYYAPSYFAPRYFPKTGAEPVVPDSFTGYAAWQSSNWVWWFVVSVGSSYVL